MSVREKDVNTQPKDETNKLSNYLWSDPPDPNKWADCVHCGLCLESCPTYEQTGQEQHSPRGRVHLIKSVAEGRLVVDEEFYDPVFLCLDCRACTTACPADVNVGGLIEEARGQIWQAILLRRGFSKSKTNAVTCKFVEILSKKWFAKSCSKNESNKHPSKAISRNGSSLTRSDRTSTEKI